VKGLVAFIIEGKTHQMYNSAAFVIAATLAATWMGLQML